MLWERSIREDSPPFCSAWQSIDISDSVGGSTARQTCSRDYYDCSSPLLAVSSSQRGVIPCMLDFKPCMGSSNMCNSIREDPNHLERCLCNLLVALEIFPCRLDPGERSCPHISYCQCQDYGLFLAVQSHTPPLSPCCLDLKRCFCSDDGDTRMKGKRLELS
ncbi:uncharacterized protein M6G45_007095 isoform 3-T3 [Spheniscus humboldti]